MRRPPELLRRAYSAEAASARKLREGGRRDCQWTSKSEWARDRGQSNAHAQRTVAAQWLKILHRMWVTNTPYNEALYLASLIQHGSPLIAWMQSGQRGDK